MTTSTAQLQFNDKLSRWIGYSIAFHVFLFLAFAVRAFFSPSEEIKMEQTIRVDIVALPDRASAKLPPAPPAPAEKKELPTPPAPPKPAPVETVKPQKPVVLKPVVKPDTPKVDLNKNKHEEAAALKRLQALERLQQQQPDSAPEAAKSDAPPAPPKRGNQLSNGGALHGVAKLDDQQYTQTVQQHVTQHWNLPQFLSSATLSALVRVYVDAQGNLIKKVLVRSSNNPVFDQSAMQAVESSLPLPHPPDDLVNIVSVRGIDIDFTPDN